MPEGGGVWDANELALTAVLTVIMQLSCFLIAFACQFDKITDLAGSSNFIINAVLTLVLNGTYFTRQVVVTSLVCLWGVRLGGFLLYRVLRRGHDARFNEMRARFFAFLVFWILQIIWVWCGSLPVMFLNSANIDVKLGSRDYIGWALFGVGFIVEAIADFSRSAFNNSAANRGKLLSTGIWAWSRHPNYFGEILLWTGIFLSSSSVFKANTSWAYTSVISPITTFMLLMFVSGITLSEDRYDRRFGNDSFYLHYKSTTSPLIPFPPSLFASMPAIVKKVLFCEYDRYSRVLRNEE